MPYCSIVILWLCQCFTANRLTFVATAVSITPGFLAIPCFTATSATALATAETKDQYDALHFLLQFLYQES